MRSTSSLPGKLAEKLVAIAKRVKECKRANDAEAVDFAIKETVKWTQELTIMKIEIELGQSPTL